MRQLPIENGRHTTLEGVNQLSAQFDANTFLWEIPMRKLSFVIPVYNSAKTIGQVVREIIEAIDTIETALDYEIILIDDGSKDSVYGICSDIGRENPKIRPFRLSKNFGQANALMAGLDQATGDFIVCLDDDLQTPPGEFPKLYQELILGNYDVVYGYYPVKQHNWFRNLGTKANSIMQKLVLGKPSEMQTSSYFIARKYVVDVVKQYDKPFPYLPGLFMQATGNVACIPIRHASRHEGKSGYNLTKLLKLWLDGFTNFSIKPLRLATFSGFIIAVVAFVMAVFLFIFKLCNVDIQEGWTSITTLILFIGGIQMLLIGILGEYVGRIYLSINKTPQYVISKTPEDIKSKVPDRVQQH